jgi:S-adenosylmethionine uptake transporter
MGLAFQWATSSSVVAPFHYTQIIWGTALGYLIFGDVPTKEVMTGAVLLIVSGLYIIWGERKAQKRKRERKFE